MLEQHPVPAKKMAATFFRMRRHPSEHPDECRVLEGDTVQ
jgi:hypothetical protein